MFRIIKHFTIYQNNRYYSAFPAVVSLGNGKLIVAFRRAPNYNGLPGIPETYFQHGDILSQLVCCYSDDNGDSWSDASLIYSPPVGGSQDGGLFYDGKYIYANSFIWKYVPKQVAEELKKTGRNEFIHCYLQTMVPAGSYIMRSKDCGKSWEGPFIPAPLPINKEVLPGDFLTIHNRGNIVRASDKRLLLVGQALGFSPGFNSSVVIYESCDNGEKWEYFSTAADCRGVSIFEEPRLHITPSGKYVMLIRCHRDGDQLFERAVLYITESLDKGKTWSTPVNTKIHAEPATSFQLDKTRIAVAYGYRKAPFGIRLRICNEELTDIESAQEYIIRDDAGNIDTGYPWISRIGKNKFLITYYINKREYKGAAQIEGTLFEINNN